MTSVYEERPSSEPAPGATLPTLAERFEAVRNLTETLAAPLSAEDQTVQSMPDVSPTKWHRAHVSWFFETFLLEPYLPGYSCYHPEFSYLFNSYYEAIGRRYTRANRGLVSRPGCDDVTRYRRYVDENMMRLLEHTVPDRPAFLVELGLHHEQQHQELLLMDIKHVLSMSPLDPLYIDTQRPAAPKRIPATGWLAFGESLTTIGHAGGTFCFDNETPSHTVQLPGFEIADRLVTCGQWLDFIADGGYERPELWLSDGWAAVQEEQWNAPLYWRSEGGSLWSVYTLNGRRSVDRDEPVCHVSYYEADAFARWSGVRLPTEFEWEAAAQRQPVRGRFLDTEEPHPRPQAFSSMYGDAWAWTASAYLPYPGYKPAAGAVGEYNGKFMVNQHVLRGGSCVTPDGHVRATYRNFFPPSARWPFTGVRLARDL
jgi:ergothioneine biosynthesis protein EgtB